MQLPPKNKNSWPFKEYVNVKLLFMNSYMSSGIDGNIKKKPYMYDRP